MKPIAWYDPTNGMVSTDKDSPLFTPLGQVWPLYPQPEQEPVAYDKTEMNCFVQDLYDKRMQEGKHGHYETMFHVVHQAIKRIPPQRTWVGLTDEDFLEACQIAERGNYLVAFQRIQAKLKEKNT